MIRLNCDDETRTIHDLMNTRVINWYMATYPTDDLGPMIPTGLTFWDIVSILNIGADFYSFLGDTADSVVRERIFAKTAEIVGCDYDTVYNTWMGG